MDAMDFLKTIEKPQFDIRNRLDQQRKKKLETNRKKLIPIIESIMFLERQNISLRGYRDDGPIVFNSNDNEGNFRELLKYRSTYEETLLNHLTNINNKATYTSKTTQNELIECCGELIQNKIIKRIKEAKFYSIIFDETTDINKISQMSLSFGYITDGKVREDFFNFIDCHNGNFENF